MSDVPHSEGIFADTSSFPAQSCFGTETFESIVWSNLVSPLNISVVTEIHSLHSKFCVCRKNASKFLSFGKSVLFTEFLLQIAPVIFVRLQVSQFGAIGKWVNKLCFPPGLKLVPLKFCTRGGTGGVCINSTTPRGASSVELDVPSHKPLSKGFSHSGNSCERLLVHSHACGFPQHSLVHPQYGGHGVRLSVHDFLCDMQLFSNL